VNGQQAESFNPYAAPLAGPEVADPFQQDDTHIRRQFIDCEANVRTIAGVLMLGGVFVAGSCAIPGFVFVAQHGMSGLGAAALMGLVAIFGIAQVVVGFQLQSFRQSARTGAIVFCAIWLLFIPVGTILGGVCLWYLMRPAARFVFTQQYFDIIQRTPQVRFRTNPASWGILIAILFGFVGLIIFGGL
jgi:hypothetical protein